jgi:hypothetical protein
MKHLLLPLAALLLFSVAYLSGAEVSTQVVEDETASIIVSSGLGRLGAVLGDLLWVQLDQYHHMWMYQGNDWTTDRDYLQQLWLITRLNPGYAEAYLSGGNHLAVNLGAPEAGVELLRRGLANCPGNDRLVWEYAIVLWRTDYLGARATQEAVWDYMELFRSRRGRMQEPWNYANCLILLSTTFRECTTRRNFDVISRRYNSRSEFIRDAGRVDLWSQ